jgi:hypothetical protein
MKFWSVPEGVWVVDNRIQDFRLLCKTWRTSRLSQLKLNINCYILELVLCGVCLMGNQPQDQAGFIRSTKEENHG